MDDQLFNLLTGIGIAAASGVTVLAYRHPEDYYSFSQLLLPATCIFFGAFVGFGLGTLNIVEVIRAAEQPDLLESALRRTLPNLLLVLVAIIWLWVAFLHIMSFFRADTIKHQRQREAERERWEREDSR